MHAAKDASAPARSHSAPPRELIGLSIGAGFAFAVFSMIEPLVPLQVTALGASPAMLGLLMSASTVGSLLIAIPAGILVQRLGNRLPIVLASLGMGVAFLLVYVVPALGALLGGLALYEICKMLIVVGAQAHVANLGGTRDAGLDFGLYGSAAAIGQMIGPYSSGLVIDSLGYRPAWLIMAVAAMVNGFAFLVLIGPGHFPRAAAGEERSRNGRLKELLGIPALVAILASFSVIFAMGARGTFFPVFLERLGYSAAVIGALLSLRALVSVSTRLLMRRFVSLAGGRFPALIASMVAVALGIGITPLCRDLVSLALTSVFVGIGMGMALPLSMATVAEGVPPSDRGVALGVRLSGNRLAQLINPLFFGGISQWLGIGNAFWVGGALLAGVTVPIVLWWRQGRLSRGATP